MSKWAFFSLLLGCISCSQSYKTSSPTELGEALFLTVKNDDEEGYVRLFGKQVMDESAERAAFRLLVRDLEAKNVDWSTLVWHGVDVRRSTSSTGTEMAHLTIFFADDHWGYELYGSQVIPCSRGWCAEKGPQIRK